MAGEQREEYVTQTEIRVHHIYELSILVAEIAVHFANRYRQDMSKYTRRPTLSTNDIVKALSKGAVSIAAMIMQEKGCYQCKRLGVPAAYVSSCCLKASCHHCPPPNEPGHSWSVVLPKLATNPKMQKEEETKQEQIEQTEDDEEEEEEEANGSRFVRSLALPYDGAGSTLKGDEATQFLIGIISKCLHPDRQRDRWPRAKVQELINWGVTYAYEHGVNVQQVWNTVKECTRKWHWLKRTTLEAQATWCTVPKPAKNWLTDQSQNSLVVKQQQQQVIQQAEESPKQTNIISMPLL
jgi:hypothetical protein